MPLRIAVCVKYVPDATGGRHFADDSTVHREDVDGLLLGARRVRGRAGPPDRRRVGRRGDHRRRWGPRTPRRRCARRFPWAPTSPVDVEDDDLHGTDALGTSLVLAKALEHIGYDLVVCMASTDGAMGVLPALLAERLDVPQATLLSEVSVADGQVTGRRDSDAASERLQASLPAVCVRDRPVR